MATTESDDSSIDLTLPIDWDTNNYEYDTFDKLKGIIIFPLNNNDAYFADFWEEVDYVVLFTLHLLVL